MDNERIEQSWDLIPPEGHYSSPSALLEDFNLYSTVGLEDWELSDRFSPPEGKFEIVSNKSVGDDSLYLMPVAKSYAYLFRGQGEFHNPCLPTFYRNKEWTNEDVFINRIRIEEFWLMLQQYPHVRYFIDLGLNVDYVGLAQHYGLKTDVLDLTSSLKVALFFAMCDYVKDTDSYKPKLDDSMTYIGYLYAYPFINELIPNNNEQRLRQLRVMPIGLQPFRRPGDQRGFSIHLENGKNFVAPIFSFEYTAKESQEIYEQFKSVLVEDELSKRTKIIANTKSFSIDAIKITAARYGYKILGRKTTVTRAIDILKKHKLSILRGNPSWNLSREERIRIYEDYKKHGAKELVSSIVQRAQLSDGKRIPYMDLYYIGTQELLRAFKKGCASLPGYNSGISFMKQGNQMCGLGLNYGRPQTLPNRESGKIDKWDYLPWENYQRPNKENRFDGYYPKESLVIQKKDGTIVDLTKNHD